MRVNVGQLQFDSGKMIEAGKYGQPEEDIQLELTPEEQEMADTIKVSSSTNLLYVRILSSMLVSAFTNIKLVKFS